MSVDLYYTPDSTPCRSVMLTAKAINLELNLKPINLTAKDHLKPDFLAINPQHCVPTIVDSDFILWESRAICKYLVSSYGKETSFYPSDHQTRAMVDRLLYFDIETLYKRFREYLFPVLYEDGGKLNPDKLAPLEEALGWLNDMLADHEWAVGDTITVADCVIVATVSTIEAAGIPIVKHCNVTAWLERCKSTLPGYAEANQPGVEEFAKVVKEKLGIMEDADSKST
ncbi:glutathione S-transferase 1-like [Cherax quadricarinatus]|uniref:glutathione S-transferase 1-like n=1 Tax=Cherax quadricarinatus TaxID=27406 RepID=UPI00387E3548